MKLLELGFFSVILAFAAPSTAGDAFESDFLTTSPVPIKMTFIGHGTLMFHLGETVIHIDPVGTYADYSKMPKADIIFITHEHRDHLDPDSIQKIRKPDTDIVLSEKCTKQIQGGIVMKNGDVKTVRGIKVEAVPAYNIFYKRASGEPFHPKGVGNGYVLNMGGKRIYVAGDTENIPEMKRLKNIDCAFLPMNVPYTMTPEMVAKAARMFRPKILYPYHYGYTNPQEIVDLLKNDKYCEVRIRKLR